MALQPQQLKKTPTDQWSIREKLALASSVERTRNQNWVSVSRQIKSFAEPNRPPDWFSQKNCALQYGFLLEDVEHPKRKRGEEIATPGSLIVKKLTQERIAELEKLIVEGNARHQKLRKELDLITAGRMDDKIDEIIDELNKQAEDKVRQEAVHHKWLKERELEAERQRHLRLHMLANQKTKRQTRTISDASDSMQSDDSNLPGHCATAPESPQPPQPPAAPTLLTTLLRSPSDSPNQSPRTSHTPSPAPAPVAGTPSTAAGNLLLPQPLSIGQRSLSTDSQHSGSATPVHTPTAAQAPTLSPLLELPTSANTTPSSSTTTTTATTTTTTEDKKPVVTIKTELLGEIKQEIVEDIVQQNVDRVETVSQTGHEQPKVEPIQPTQPSQQQQSEQQTQQEHNQQQQQQQQSSATDRELDDALSVMVDVVNGNQPALETVAVEEVPDSEIVSYIDEMRQDMEQGKVQPVVEEQQQKQMIAAQLRQSAEEVVAAKADPDMVAVSNSQVKQEPADVEIDESLPSATTLQPPAPTPPVEQETKQEPAPTAAEEIVAPQIEPKATRSKPPSRESTPASTKVPSRSASPARQKVTSVTSTPSTPKTAASATPSRASPAKEKEPPTFAANKDANSKDRAKMSITIPQAAVTKEKVSTPPPKTPTKTRDTPTTVSKPREPNETASVKSATQSSVSTPTRANNNKTIDDESVTATTLSTSSTTVQPSTVTTTTTTATTTATTNNEAVVSTSTASEDRNEDTDDKSQCSNNTNVGDEAASGLDSQETESREDSVTGNSPAAPAVTTEEDARQEEPAEDGKELKKEAIVIVPPLESSAADAAKDATVKVEPQTNIIEEDPVDEMIEEEVSEDEDLGPDAGNRAVVDVDRDVADQVFKSSQGSKKAAVKDDDVKEDRALASPEEEEGAERSEERERDLKIWKRSALLIWRTAANHSHAAVFMAPVTDEMAPGYADIVYRPMDLTGIRRSIESGAIRTTIELLRDMMLMFQNAIMYNSADHDVYLKAIEMRFDVMKQIEEWMANEAAERGTSNNSALLAGLSAALGVKRAARHRHSENLEPPAAKKPRRSTGAGGSK